MSAGAPEVVGLVLAAGASRRMGPDRNKLLEPVDGRPLVTIPVEAMRAAGVERIVVVLGHEAEAVRGVLPDDVECIVCDGHAEGMGSSLAAGARAIVARAPDAALLVCVADLPDLTAEPIRQLLAGCLPASPDRIGVPTCGGRRGHPVLFGAAHGPALAAISGDRGARDVVERAGDSAIVVEVGTPSILRDLDTPEAFAARVRERG